MIVMTGMGSPIEQSVSHETTQDCDEGAGWSIEHVLHETTQDCSEKVSSVGHTVGTAFI